MGQGVVVDGLAGVRARAGGRSQRRCRGSRGSASALRAYDGVPVERLRPPVVRIARLPPAASSPPPSEGWQARSRRLSAGVLLGEVSDIVTQSHGAVGPQPNLKTGVVERLMLSLVTFQRVLRGGKEIAIRTTKTRAVRVVSLLVAKNVTAQLGAGTRSCSDRSLYSTRRARSACGSCGAWACGSADRRCDTCCWWEACGRAHEPTDRGGSERSCRSLPSDRRAATRRCGDRCESLVSPASETSICTQATGRGIAYVFSFAAQPCNWQAIELPARHRRARLQRHQLRQGRGVFEERHGLGLTEGLCSGRPRWCVVQRHPGRIRDPLATTPWRPGRPTQLW